MNVSTIRDELVDSFQDSLVADSIAISDGSNVSPTMVTNIVVPHSDVVTIDLIISPLVPLSQDDDFVPSTVVVHNLCGGGVSSLAMRVLGVGC